MRVLLPPTVSESYKNGKGKSFYNNDLEAENLPPVQHIYVSMELTGKVSAHGGNYHVLEHSA